MLEHLSNITEGLGELGNVAEGLNPVEDITPQAEELTGGLSDTAAQATEGISDSIGGLFN